MRGWSSEQRCSCPGRAGGSHSPAGCPRGADACPAAGAGKCCLRRSGGGGWQRLCRGGPWWRGNEPSCLLPVRIGFRFRCRCCTRCRPCCGACSGGRCRPTVGANAYRRALCSFRPQLPAGVRRPAGEGPPLSPRRLRWHGAHLRYPWAFRGLSWPDSLRPAGCPAPRQPGRGQALHALEHPIGAPRPPRPLKPLNSFSP